MPIKVISIPPNYFYASLFASLASWYFLPNLNIIKSPYNHWGWIIIVLGIFLTLWSWLSFKKHDTPEDFSQSKALVTDGPFRFSRNPMYIGMFLITLGAGLVSRNLLGIISSLFFLFILNNMFIPFEEAKNQNTFGKAFLDYKKKVRRWF